MGRGQTILVLLLIPLLIVKSQDNFKISTKSARFHMSMTSEVHNEFTTNQQLLFESTAAKQIHEDVSLHNGENGVHAIITSVHVQDMGKEVLEADNRTQTSLKIDSVVSITFSGKKDSTFPSVDSILSSSITPGDLMKTFKDDGLVSGETELLEISFSEFDGSAEERGIYSTETEIVTKRKNNGWPMFFAGMMLATLVITTIMVGRCIWSKEKRSRKPMGETKPSCRSVYYEGDVDLEVVTTASGVLGLKGHHPQAVQKENMTPNKTHHRKKRGATSSSNEDTALTVASSQLEQFSPMTQQTAASGASRQPLGITSMRKLNTFLTPQKPKSDRVGLSAYNIDRLTQT